LFFNSITCALRKSFLLLQQGNFLNDAEIQTMFATHNSNATHALLLHDCYTCNRKSKFFHFFSKNISMEVMVLLTGNALLFQALELLKISRGDQYWQIFIPNDIAKYNSRYMVFL